MPISLSELAVGRYYITATKQLRRIDKLTKDQKKRTRVHYSSKSARLINPGFWGAATKKNPALATTFARACEKRLTAAEVADLRRR